MSGGIDPSLLNDFLTETSELIEGLDSDLVRLESASGDQSRDLLNGIFRALHTVKGAAGFLNLDELTRFAHAAEDALNKLRTGEAEVTATTLDVLLKSVDVLREMHGALGEGRDPEPCPQDVLDGLHSVAGDEGDSTAAASTSVCATPTAGESPIVLSPAKDGLLDLMASDLGETVEQARRITAGLSDTGARAASLAQMEELLSGLVRTLEFFELPEAVATAVAASEAVSRLADGDETSLTPMVAAIAQAWDAFGRLAEALTRRSVVDPGWARVRARLVSSCDEDVASEADACVADRGVVESVVASQDEATGARAPAKSASSKETAAKEDAGIAGQTIRVEVGRLESLMNLVGQLVLTKNRFLALSRRLREHELPAQLNSDTLAAAGELDRITGQLQMGVMRTRMQPLSKLFDRYPRVIRDIARSTGKQIRLEITGRETEVDKSVLELLGDPLVHMLRNSADHGIETGATRRAAGKPEEGTIHVEAEHCGSHVRVIVRDDGKGIDPRVIGPKAVEKGIITEAELASMPDDQIIQLIFAPGFSTAEKITDLSGRGVGMDVVRTSVARMGGAVNVSSVVGQGSRVEIIIPLTVAIMPAMVVGVQRHFFCIPLQTIVEIVRPQQDVSHSLVGQAVMKLRDEVLPLIDLGHTLGDSDAPSQRRFAVVIDAAGRRAGLLVDKLVGQQEIVIRPLDDECVQGGPFAGATIREEGDVSLIVDVSEVLRRWQAGAASTQDRRVA
ncbi:MAG: chemotaxis protein CheA [Phycisphaeraceae bacterium]|nr:chemotaxis protein CheA [Phycisphaeraceae bacterium]